MATPDRMTTLNRKYCDRSNREEEEYGEAQTNTKTDGM
jgi:hypothetical protein